MQRIIIVFILLLLSYEYVQHVHDNNSLLNMNKIKLKIEIYFFYKTQNKQILTTPTSLSVLSLNKVVRKFVIVINFIRVGNYVGKPKGDFYLLHLVWKLKFAQLFCSKLLCVIIVEFLSRLELVCVHFSYSWRKPPRKKTRSRTQIHGKYWSYIGCNVLPIYEEASP
jgi:hypothetical protein